MVAFSLFGFLALRARLYEGLAKMSSPWWSILVISLTGFRIDTPVEVSVRLFPQRPNWGGKTYAEYGRHHPRIERKKKGEMNISVCLSLFLTVGVMWPPTQAPASTPSPPCHAAWGMPLDCDTKWTLLLLSGCVGGIRFAHDLGLSGPKEAAVLLVCGCDLLNRKREKHCSPFHVAVRDRTAGYIHPRQNGGP